MLIPLGGSFRRIVVGDLESDVLNVRILLDLILEALLTLVGSTGSGLKRDHHDFALLADELGQGVGGRRSASSVVGSNRGYHFRRISERRIN